MTIEEQRLIIWAISVLLALLAFIGSLGVNALIKMARDIGDIKLTIHGHNLKHDALEKRVAKLEETI